MGKEQVAPRRTHCKGISTFHQDSSCGKDLYCPNDFIVDTRLNDMQSANYENSPENKTENNFLGGDNIEKIRTLPNKIMEPFEQNSSPQNKENNIRLKMQSEVKEKDTSKCSVNLNLDMEVEKCNPWPLPVQSNQDEGCLKSPGYLKNRYIALNKITNLNFSSGFVRD